MQAPAGHFVGGGTHDAPPYGVDATLPSPAGRAATLSSPSPVGEGGPPPRWMRCSRPQATFRCLDGRGDPSPTIAKDTPTIVGEAFRLPPFLPFSVGGGPVPFPLTGRLSRVDALHVPRLAQGTPFGRLSA